jgi:hypothetical protein
MKENYINKPGGYTGILKEQLKNKEQGEKFYLPISKLLSDKLQHQTIITVSI